MSTDPLSAGRERMIEEHLRARGIRDERVLAAMSSVPRELFVAPGDVPLAYDDRALGIACGQTISQPYIVALMTEALDVSPGMKVLELGTGSGYQAAVLGAMGAEVYSLERHPELACAAAERVNLLGLNGVSIRTGDGRAGWVEEAPFDRAIVTAAAADLPPAVWDQLSEGGKIVAPLGPAEEQTLLLIRKIGGQRLEEPLTGCRFVPLV